MKSFIQARIDRSRLVSFVACVSKFTNHFLIPATAQQTRFSWIPDLQDFLFSITIERVFTIHHGRGEQALGVTGQGDHSLRCRLLDSVICGLWESEKLPQGKLPLLVFWFCWMGGRVGGGVFTRCIIGVYYRCVYCGKECRFLFRLRGCGCD
jgi:hypothetical protein